MKKLILLFSLLVFVSCEHGKVYPLDTIIAEITCEGKGGMTSFRAHNNNGILKGHLHVNCLYQEDIRLEKEENPYQKLFMQLMEADDESQTGVLLQGDQ